MTRAFVLCGAKVDAPVRWAVGDEERLLSAGEAERLTRLPADIRHAESLTLALPGEMAATRCLTLPVRGDRALEDAARLAFEDVLAEPVDRFHFAFGPVGGDGRRLVSALPKELMAEWMTAIERAGLDPDIITLDHLVLWASGYESVILHEGDRVMAALPAGGLSGNATLVNGLLQMMPDKGSTLEVAVGERANAGMNADLVLADDRALCAFCLSGLAERVVSFRRGAFVKSRDWLSLARAWKMAGALMAACFALWLSGVAADAIKHDRAAQRLQSEAEARFTEAFPNTVVRDLRRQAAQRVGGGGASSFLPLSADLASALEDAGNVQLTGIRFTMENELIADLTFADAAALEALKAALESRGVPTREGGNLRREDNGDFAGQLFLGGAS